MLSKELEVLKKDAYPLASKLASDDQIINLSFDKIIKNPKSKLNFIVQDGDSIIYWLQEKSCCS